MAKLLAWLPWRCVLVCALVFNLIPCLHSIRTSGPVRPLNDLSLWIDERQVSQLSGVKMAIFAIQNGHLAPFLLDPSYLDQYLGVVPADVSTVTFTWKSGDHKIYYYHFDRLHSDQPNLLPHPKLNIDTSGQVPTSVSTFQVQLPCTIDQLNQTNQTVDQNLNGLVPFELGLNLMNQNRKSLAGTPFRFRLHKHCAATNKLPDPNCDQNCVNGRCDQRKICRCHHGYNGNQCDQPMCFPPCQNGGVCMRPGYCDCPAGFQGPQCEGGLCTERCENGGKCLQNDRCQCTSGYYGNRCRISLCSLPCLNGGRCVALEQCRCRPGFQGIQCEYFDHSTWHLFRSSSKSSSSDPLV